MHTKGQSEQLGAVNKFCCHRPRTHVELAHTVRAHLRRCQHQPHIVCRFFQGKHVRYAAT